MKIHSHLLLAAALATCAAPSSAHLAICDDEQGVFDSVTCNVVLAGFVTMAYTMQAVDQVKQLTLPWTPVQVELPDGSVVDGNLSPMAVEGRTVRPGDAVWLTNCEKSRLCELRFRRMDPTNTIYPTGSPRYGEQALWYIDISPDGVPRSTLLKIDGKVQLDTADTEAKTSAAEVDTASAAKVSTEARAVSTPSPQQAVPAFR